MKQGVMGLGLGEALGAWWAPGLWALGWGAGSGAAQEEASEARGLGLSERWIQTDRGRWRYWVRRPAGREGERLPMILMLHGCKQRALDFAVGSAMIGPADREGVILVYPEQDAGRAPGRCWRWFEPGHQRRGSGEPGVIAAIAREAGEELGADMSRVFVAGLSAGGAMALLAARAYPEVFAAAGCHSGLPPESAVDARSALLAMRKGAPEGALSGEAQTPVIVFHGEADRTVIARNGELCFERLSPMGEAREQRLARGGRRARRISRWRDGRPVGELWLIEGAGHAWSGGDEAGSHAEAAGPLASEEALRFFLSQRPKASGLEPAAR